MKKLVFVSLIMACLPFCAMAQTNDDLYFIPKKKTEKKVTAGTPAKVVVETDKAPTTVYASPVSTVVVKDVAGNVRDVDEYNRRASYVEQLDSAGNDVITFSPELGAYPDSAIQADYEYTRRMTRFDDYDWVDAYNEGYRDGYTSTWGWYDPWYYNSWYYSGWYGGWHYPWRYGWYSGWYDPWYRPYWHYGWHSSWYPVVVHRTYRGITGTSNHGRVNRSGNYNSRFNGYRGSADTKRTSTSTFGGQRNSTISNRPAQNNSYQSSNNFGGSRNAGGSFGGTRSNSGGSSRGGGSFGGRR